VILFIDGSLHTVQRTGARHDQPPRRRRDASFSTCGPAFGSIIQYQV